MLFFMIFMLPITAIVTQSPVGKAIADRIAGRVRDDPRMVAEIEALRGELDQMHEHLAEVNERLDFNERLLAQRNDGLVTPPEGVAR